MAFNGMISKYSDKASARLKRISRPFHGIWPRTSDALIGIFALLVLALAILTYIKPVVTWGSQLVSGNKYVVAIDGWLNPLRNPNLLLSEDLPVYDGHRLLAGMRIEGPALIDRIDTTILITESFGAVIDAHGIAVPPPVGAGMHGNGRAACQPVQLYLIPREDKATLPGALHEILPNLFFFFFRSDYARGGAI